MNAGRGYTSQVRPAPTLAAAVAALVSAGALAPSARAADARVGVIVVGGDRAATGTAQRTLEVRVATLPSTTLRTAGEIAPVIANRAPPARTADPVARKKAADLIAEASRAYYEDRLVEALDRLSAAGAVLELAPRVPVEDRVRLLLWRAAVLLALQSRDKAEAEARAALALSPQLTVDVSVFRPSLATLVEEQRARALPAATILFDGIPPGAELRVDDRTGSPRMALVPGRHWLWLRAPGFHEVERPFEIAADVVIPAAMPLALEEGVDRALTAIVARGDVPPEMRPALERLADRLQVDALVLAAMRGDPAADARGLVWWRANARATASPTFAATTAGLAQLADWAAAHVASDRPATVGAAVATTASPTPAATPATASATTVRPPRTGTPRPPRSRVGTVGAFTWGADAGFAVVSRTRRIQGGGSGFSSGFTGVGPRLALDARMGALQADLGVSYVSYAMSRLDVNLPSQGRTTIDGGATLTVDAVVGWRFDFGGDPDASAVAIGAGGFFEQHDAKDIVDGGTALGLFPSETRLGALVRVDGRYRVGNVSGGPLFVTGALGIAPFTTWSESPAGTSGRDARTAPVPSLSAGLRWQPGRLGVAVAYAGEIRNATFSGDAAAPLDPAIRDARLTQTLHGVHATAHLSF